MGEPQNRRTCSLSPREQRRRTPASRRELVWYGPLQRVADRWLGVFAPEGGPSSLVPLFLCHLGRWKSLLVLLQEGHKTLRYPSVPHVTGMWPQHVGAHGRDSRCQLAPQWDSQESRVAVPPQRTPVQEAQWGGERSRPGRPQEDSGDGGPPHCCEAMPAPLCPQCQLGREKGEGSPLKEELGKT